MALVVALLTVALSIGSSGVGSLEILSVLSGDWVLSVTGLSRSVVLFVLSLIVVLDASFLLDLSSIVVSEVDWTLSIIGGGGESSLTLLDDDVALLLGFSVCCRRSFIAIW